MREAAEDETKNLSRSMDAITRTKGTILWKKMLGVGIQLYD